MRTSQNTLVGILLGMVALAALGVIALLLLILQRDRKPSTRTTVAAAESTAKERPAEPQPKVVDPAQQKSNERELSKTGELAKDNESEVTKLVEVEVPTRELPKTREIVDEDGVRVIVTDEGKIKPIKRIPEVTTDGNHAPPSGRTTTVQTSDDKRSVTVTKTSKDGKKVNMTVMLPALDDTSGPVTIPLGEWMKDDEENVDDFVDESEPVELQPTGDMSAPPITMIPSGDGAAPKVVTRSTTGEKKPDAPSQPTPPSKIDAVIPVTPKTPKRPVTQEKPVAKDGDSMAAFFNAQPASAVKAPSLEKLKGTWQVKVTRIDLGPGIPAPDIAEVKPFTFSIEAAGDGFVLKPEAGKGAARTLSVGATGIVARAADRSDMSLQVADGGLKGTMALPESGRLEFHATRLP